MATRWSTTVQDEDAAIDLARRLINLRVPFACDSSVGLQNHFEFQVSYPDGAALLNHALDGTPGYVRGGAAPKIAGTPLLRVATEHPLPLRAPRR